MTPIGRTAATTRRKREYAPEQRGAGYQALPALAVRHHTHLHYCRFRTIPRASSQLNAGYMDAGIPADAI
ncbi:hypothetical protein GCM10010217_02290 [Streptomyces tubercidicus]